MAGAKQTTADPDDLVWDGPAGEQCAPVGATAVAALPERPKRMLPFCGECPPSQTKKRPKGKLLQLLPFDLSVHPTAEGVWLCKTCPATYETRPQLFGHARFCEVRLLARLVTCLPRWTCRPRGRRADEQHSYPTAPCVSPRGRARMSGRASGAVAASPRRTTSPTARAVRRRSARRAVPGTARDTTACRPRRPPPPPHVVCIQLSLLSACAHAEGLTSFAALCLAERQGRVRMRLLRPQLRQHQLARRTPPLLRRRQLAVLVV